MDYQYTLGMSNTSAASTVAAENHEQMDVEELDLQSGPSNESEDESMSILNPTMIHDEGFSLQAVGISNPSPVEPSIDDDDGVDCHKTLLCQRHFLTYQRMRAGIQMLLLSEAYALVIFQRARPSLGREGKEDLTSLQLREKNNVLVAINGIQNIGTNAQEEAVQINVTILILLALEGVDSALEQMLRMKKSVKLRV